MEPRCFLHAACRATTPIAITLAVFLMTILPAFACAAQESAVLRGERITLIYPSVLSPETAALLLENRERALAYAESALDGTVNDPITVTIRASLFGGGADNSILFDLPLRMLERFEATGSVPATTLGCHEETHVVANASWSTSACTALTEGLAVFVDGQYRGGTSYHLATLGLLARGELPLLGRLLDRVWAPRLTATGIMTLYYGGASLVAFLIDSYGIDALRTFYELTWLPSSYIAEDVSRLYGCSLSEFEAAWHAYVLDATGGRALAAELFVEAVVLQSGLYGLMTSLEQMRVRSPAAVGRSAVCERILDVLRSRLGAIHDAADNLTAESAYVLYRGAVTSSEKLVSTWLRAANAYVAALGLEAGSTEYLRLLIEAEEGYTIVEDQLMLDRVRELLTQHAPTNSPD